MIFTRGKASKGKLIKTASLLMRPIRFPALAILLFLAQERPYAGAWEWMQEDFQVLMNTHGLVSFAPYVHGRSRDAQFAPGYRSDFSVYVDFFRWKGLISTWKIANTTSIERPDSTLSKLHSIRYTLTPGYRYEFDGWQLTGLLSHECIHTISREEENGAIWWNSVQVGGGTLGAYHPYLVQRYKKTRDGLWNSLEGQLRHRLDFRLSAGAFFYGDLSPWLGQNHTYRYEEFGLFRAHLLQGERSGVFADFNHHLWWSVDHTIQAKLGLSLHYFLRGRANIASLFYTWNFHDSSPHDNENSLGSLGFQIVF